MTEQELLNEIRKSAEEIQIPDSLAPEYVSAKLNTPTKPQKHLRLSARRAVSAAAVLLLCGILSAVSYQMNLTQPGQIASLYAENADTALSSDSNRETSSGDTSGENEGTAETAGTSDIDSANQPKQDAGTLYTVAKSYDQVYDVLQSNAVREAAKFRDGTAYTEGIEEDGSSSGASSFDVSDDSASAENSSDMAASSLSKKEASYSATNLQTEGVDESDTIKTDGRYIYTLTGAKITIADTADGGLTLAGAVSPKLGAADRILEFYVDEAMLFVVAECYETTLENQTPVPETSEESIYSADDSDTRGFIPLEEYKLCDSVREDYRYSTIIYAYDISDPASPRLTQTASQDGYYQTSRKIGDMIYLFTQKTLAAATSYDDTSQKGIIPCVNGKEIPYDHIYTSEEGNEGLILSSFDTAEMEQPKDMIMILHSYADIYVGTDSIYLYHSQSGNAGLICQIAKFSINNGNIDAVNAATVKGAVYDTFAINESDGALRVLTTYMDNAGVTDNQLYLFDKNLKLTGSLTGIAKNEEIYAARYLGNTAYFITYRNTDPLFAVDLTDMSNPVLLGQLEITGFSEYLHFWENGTLLGLGYETDPESGIRKGLKLVMFDISNPRELNVIDSIVLNDCLYSPGLYHYKCVLADPKKNLIGFCAEYGSECIPYYDLFSWENGRFTQKLHETLPEYEYISYDSIRGLYIEDSFYIACPTKITGYAMQDRFEKFAELEISE